MKDLGFGVTAHSRAGRRIGPTTTDMLRQGVFRAHMWVIDTLDKLHFARQHRSLQSLVNDPTGARRATMVRQAAIQATNVPNDDTRIAQVLQRLEAALTSVWAGLNAGYDVVDIGELTRFGDQFAGACTGGYVTANRITQSRGRIHLNYKFFRRLLALNPERVRDMVALTIVHEATHKWARTKDHAYSDNPRFTALTWQQAVRNADSIAVFAFLVGNPEKLDNVSWPLAPYLW